MMADLSLYERQPGHGRDRRSLDWELARAASYRAVKANRSEQLRSQLVRDVLAAGRADDEKERSASGTTSPTNGSVAPSVDAGRHPSAPPPLPGAPAPSRRWEMLLSWPMAVSLLILTAPFWLVVGAGFLVFAGIAALWRMVIGGDR